MPDKLKEKTKKPVIKVEEVEEEANIEKTETRDAKLKTEETEFKERKSAPPIVSSFSQLDSVPPAPPEEKKKSIVEPEIKKESSDQFPEKTQEEEKDDEEKDEKIPEKEQISSEEVREWLKEVRPDTTKEVEKGRSPGAKIILLIMFMLLVLGAIVGGFLYFQKNVSAPTSTETPTITSTPTPSETPGVVVEEKLDLTKYSISVLNGSGIAGEAGKVKDKLSAIGFSDDKIKTGNAESYNYTGITVSAKEDIDQKVLESIESSLSKDFKVEISEDKLQNTSSFDIVIIVGK